LRRETATLALGTLLAPADDVNIDRLLRRAFAGLHVATVGLVLGTQATSCAKTAERLVASRSGAIHERAQAAHPGAAPVAAQPILLHRADSVAPEIPPAFRRYVFEVPGAGGSSERPRDE
jgi:hypothetical protein